MAQVQQQHTIGTGQQQAIPPTRRGQGLAHLGLQSRRLAQQCRRQAAGHGHQHPLVLLHLASQQAGQQLHLVFLLRRQALQHLLLLCLADDPGRAHSCQ